MKKALLSMKAHLGMSYHKYMICLLNQSNVSNHLGCLRDCGLVTSAQQGRYVNYQLSDVRVAELLSLADELLADVAKGIYECTRYKISEEQV